MKNDRSGTTQGFNQNQSSGQSDAGSVGNDCIETKALLK